MEQRLSVVEHLPSRDRALLARSDGAERHPGLLVVTGYVCHDPDALAVARGYDRVLPADAL